jgi:hypothetical protein
MKRKSFYRGISRKVNGSWFWFFFSKGIGDFKNGFGWLQVFNRVIEKNRKLTGGRVSSGFSRELEMLFWTVLDIG